MESVLANENSSEVNVFDSLPWFHTVDLKLEFLEKIGFDGKYAIFQDPSNDNIYSLDFSVFSRSIVAKRNFKWTDFSQGSTYMCRVYAKYYFLRLSDKKEPMFNMSPRAKIHGISQ